MPDLLASTSLLPLTPAIAPRTASVAVPVVADFMAMLGELVLPPGAKPQGGKEQALAGGGKDLPVEGAPASRENEDDSDPLAAWLPAGLVPLQPVEPAPLPDAALIAPPPPGIDAAVATAPIADAVPSAFPDAVKLPDAVGLPAPAAVAASTPSAVSVSVAAAAPATPASVEQLAAVEPPAAEAMSVEGKTIPPRAQALRDKAGMAERDAPLRPVRAPAVTPQPVVPGMPVAQPAAQVFAAAISASFDSPAAPRVAEPMIAQVQASEQLRTTVQAMSGADQAPLDLSRDDWAGKMVDRIAALHDAAEATDTRIRLAPENLGNVDVSIRRDGDRLHVHFTAENPAARQLIAEAAPRLAELADARGVKLGQTSVDAGTGGQQQPGQPQSSQPARPASAVASDTQPDRDDRVA